MKKNGNETIVTEIIEDDGEFIHIRYVEIVETNKSLHIWISDEERNS